MIFIKNPQNFEFYNTYSGYSDSYGYYFPQSVCILVNLFLDEYEATQIRRYNNKTKIFASKDIQTNIPEKELIRISRKNILRAEKRWNKLKERIFVCMDCGVILPLILIKQEKRNKFHYDHYWCEMGVVKEIKEGNFLIVYSRRKGEGKIFKEKIIVKNGETIREQLNVLDEFSPEVIANKTYWRNKYLKLKEKNNEK